MSKNHLTLRSALVASAMVACASIAPAHAGSNEVTRYTHASCEGPNAMCGAIVIAAAGLFTIDWSSVDARDSQPGGPYTHPQCSGVFKKIEKNVESADYNTFVVPASCAYKLKAKILSGNGKDENLYLTPGCKILAQIQGDAVSNKWVLEVDALNDQVPTNSNKKPVDPAGHKCGRQKNAGF